MPVTVQRAAWAAAGQHRGRNGRDPAKDCRAGHRASTTAGREELEQSINRSMLDDPLGRLSGSGCDVVEVAVVVQDREGRGLGDCCDEEIGHLASLETVGGELTLNSK